MNIPVVLPSFPIKSVKGFMSYELMIVHTNRQTEITTLSLNTNFVNIKLKLAYVHVALFPERNQLPTITILQLYISKQDNPCYKLKYLYK